MKIAAFVVMVCAWGCLFMWRGTAARIAQLIVFGALGALFTLAGGFQYWWNSHMLPSQSSPFIFGCGLLTLLSQAGTLLQGVLGNEGGMDWPESTPRRPRPRQSHRPKGPPPP